MSVTETLLGLKKQDLGDPNWHTELNDGFDQASARIAGSNGSADPNGSVRGFWVGQRYTQTSVGSQNITVEWICTTAGADPASSVWERAPTPFYQGDEFGLITNPARGTLAMFQGLGLMIRAAGSWIPVGLQKSVGDTYWHFNNDLTAGGGVQMGPVSYETPENVSPGLLMLVGWCAFAAGGQVHFEASVNGGSFSSIGGAWKASGDDSLVMFDVYGYPTPGDDYQFRVNGNTIDTDRPFGLVPFVLPRNLV